MMASNDMDLAKIEQGVRLILVVCIKTQPFILKRFSTNTTMKW